MDLIESAIFRDKYALVVSMDMQGAFDNLKTESIIRGMKNKLYPKKPLHGTQTSLKIGLLQLTY